MYIDRMKKARKFIANLHARKLRMMNWIVIDYLPNGDVPARKVLVEDSCGTTGCIAGWVQVMAGPQIHDYTHAPDFSRPYLGLKVKEADALFMVQWPTFLFDKFEVTGDFSHDIETFDMLKPSVRKKAILKTLDYLIEYGFTWLQPSEQSNRVKQFGH